MSISSVRSNEGSLNIVTYEEFELVEPGQSPGARAHSAIATIYESVKSPVSSLSDTDRLLCMSPVSFCEIMEWQALEHDLAHLDRANEANARRVDAFKQQQNRGTEERKRIFAQVHLLFSKVIQDKDFFIDEESLRRSSLGASNLQEKTETT